MVKRQMSEHARAAKAIRTELKAAYPHTKFSVTSESFAGGDAVRVTWTDGPTMREVQAITGKYQYGRFDGMIDLYEYTNVRKDIPQAKYVQTHRASSREALVEIADMLNSYWGWNLRVAEYGNWIDHETDVAVPGDGWASHRINRQFHTTSLVCPACKRGTMPRDLYCGDCGAAQREEEVA